MNIDKTIINNTKQICKQKNKTMNGFIKKIKYLVFITILLGMTGCGGYYCNEGDILSGTQCHRTYSPSLRCLRQETFLYNGKCVYRDNVALVQSDPLYSCAGDDTMSGGLCVSKDTYDAYRK